MNVIPDKMYLHLKTYLKNFHTFLLLFFTKSLPVLSSISFTAEIAQVASFKKLI